MRLISLSILLLISVFVFSGCMHQPAPYLPVSWQGSPIELSEVEDQGENRLYILIMYENTMCAHTALRIYSPEHGSLFWDPAGGYGDPKFPIRAKRDKDLVVKPVPSIADYLEFRRYIETAKAEIFEFKISTEQAERLIKLLNVENRNDEAHYSTKTVSLKCATAISNFLEIHASDILPVTKEFYPHNLSKRLYELNPERVILWDYQTMYEYTPGN